MFCKYCGSQLKNEAKFCSACGKPVVEMLEEKANSSKQKKEKDRIINEESETIKENAIKNNDFNNSDLTQQNIKKRSHWKIFILLLIVAVFLIIGGVFVSKIVKTIVSDNNEKEAKKVVELFIEEYKRGNIEDVTDADIYNIMMNSVPEELTPVVEYFLVDEEVFHRIWTSTHETLEYEINSVEEQEDGSYIVNFTISNKNMMVIIVGSVDEMVGNSGETIAGALTGILADQFMDEYERQRDNTNSTVSQDFQMKICINDDGEMYLDYDEQLYLFIAKALGISDKYLESSY